MPNDDGMLDQLLYGALGRVSALESRTDPGMPDTASHLPSLADQYRPGLYGAYWECTSRSAGTYTIGTDWTPQFGDLSATSQVVYQIPSTSGQIFSTGEQGEGRYAQVAVFVGNAFTVAGRIRIEGAGGSPRVQLHCNGGFQEFTASSDFTMALRGDGQPNLIKLISNTFVGDLEIRWSLWDGITTFWIDPHANQSAQSDLGGDYGGGVTGREMLGSGQVAAGPQASMRRPVPLGYQSIDDTGSSSSRTDLGAPM